MKIPATIATFVGNSVHRSSTYGWYWCWLYVALLMAVQLATLTNYPSIFVDEPWFCNASWNLVTQGTNFDTMHAGALDQFGNASIRRPFLGQLPWAASFAVAGLGFFQARLVSWLLGCVLLWLTYHVSSKLYSANTGSFAVVLLVASPGFIAACHYARQDIFLATAGLGAFALALTAFECPGGWRHYLVGLIAGLSVDIHQNGIIYVVAVAVTYFAIYGWRTWSTRAAWSCVAGGVTGAVWFACIHLLSEPSLYFKLNSFTTGTYGVPILGGIVAIIRSGLLEFMRFGFHEDGLLFAVMMAAFLFLLRRGGASDRKLLAYTAGIYLGFTLFVGNNSQLYRVLLLPFLFCGVAECLLTISFRQRENATFSPSQAYVATLALLLACYYPLVYGNALRKSLDYDYDRLGSRIAAVIEEATDRAPAETCVVAMPTWWFALHDFHFRSNHTIGYREWFNQEPLHDSLALLRPDFIVLDDDWRENFTVAQGTEKEPLQIPREPFLRFLNQQAVPIATINDPVHQTIQIYQVRWE